jgi:hypothetical protein
MPTKVEKLYTKQELFAKYYEDLCKIIDKGINVNFENTVTHVRGEWEPCIIWDAEVGSSIDFQALYGSIPECKPEGYRSAHACVNSFIKAFSKVLKKDSKC